MFYDEKDRLTGFRNYRGNFPPALERYIVEWLQELPQSPGRYDTPTHWKSTDKPSC